MIKKQEASKVPKKATANKRQNSGIKNLKPFKPGQSGNPNGRPKMPEDIKRAFKEMTPIAIEKLKEIIESPNTKETDRLRAIDIVLDRGLGKPTQELQVETSNVPQVVFIGADHVKD